MKRYTRKALEADVRRINLQLLQSGSNYQLEVGARYEWTALDATVVSVSGQRDALRNVEMGSPRQCKTAAYEFLSNHSGRVSYEHLTRAPCRFTREQCLALLSPFVDWQADYHTLSSDICDAIAGMARACKYRKPKNANGSTAREFFRSLSRLSRQLEKREQTEKELKETARLQAAAGYVVNSHVLLYRCPKCGTTWPDVWECEVNADCPRCGARHISPARVMDISDPLLQLAAEKRAGGVKQ